MMFEDLSKLYEAFFAYKENREYRFTYSVMKLEHWAEEKAFKMEDESTKKNYDTIKSELDRVRAPNFY